MKRLSFTSPVKMLNKACHPWVKHVTHDMGSLSSGTPIFISHWPVSTPRLLLPKAQSIYYTLLFPYLSHEAAPKPLFIQLTELCDSPKSLLCQLSHREQIIIRLASDTHRFFRWLKNMSLKLVPALHTYRHLKWWNNVVYVLFVEYLSCIMWYSQENKVYRRLCGVMK